MNALLPISNVLLFAIIYLIGVLTVAYTNRREFKECPEKGERYKALPLPYKLACCYVVLPLLAAVVFHGAFPLLGLLAFMLLEAACVRWYRKAGLLGYAIVQQSPDPIPQVLCLRCDSTQLLPSSDSSPEMEFFECPGCRRAYARAPGGALTYRWLHPVSLALYGFAFRSGTREQHVRKTVHDLLSERSDEQIAWNMEEIELELSKPTQMVSEMLPEMGKAEDDCRSFLRTVLDEMKLELAARSGEGESKE